MTYQELQDLIVSRFWSDGLKQEVEKRNYSFPPMDLMAIVYQHTERYDERLSLLQMFADHVPEVSDYAKQVITWERKKLADFLCLAPGEVYELRISMERWTEWSDFLCADFDSCLAMIDRYYEHYDWKEESPLTRYSIVRRKLLRCGDGLEHEELGSCDLLPGKIIGRVYFGPPGEYDDCGGICWECEHECISNQEAVYPAFLADKSPVRYRLPDGTVHFGITLADMSDLCLCYIIPLDGEMLANRDFGQFCLGHDHEHIPCPDVDLARRAEIPDDLWENYKAFVAFLNQEVSQ